MDGFYSQLEFDLNSRLNFIAQENLSQTEVLELSIKESSSTIKKLKAYIMKKKFSSQEEEIAFFKTVKPKFLSKFHYYYTAYNIHIHKPGQCKAIVKDYYEREQKKLKNFIDDHREFYKYYKTESTYLDSKYFVRNQLDYKLCLADFHFEMDPKFNAAMDYLVSRFLARELLEIYITEQLELLDRTQADSPKSATPDFGMNWTASKASLAELIYALHSAGAVNNGSVGIRDLSACFSKIFNIEMGDIYRTYQDIKSRSNSTLFLQSLKEHLEEKIREEVN